MMVRFIGGENHQPDKLLSCNVVLSTPRNE